MQKSIADLSSSPSTSSSSSSPSSYFASADFDNVEFDRFLVHPESFPSSSPSPLSSSPASPLHKLCVWLMVCDEESHVEQTLRSAADIADCFVVGDTGSRDGTVEKVISVCKSLHKPFYVLELGDPRYPEEFPFFNFAAYRNRILRFARRVAKWLLALDASDHVRNGPMLLQAIDRLPEECAAAIVTIQWNDEAHEFQRLLNGKFDQICYRDARHNYIDLPASLLCANLTDCGFSLFQDRRTAKDSARKYEQDVRYFEWRLKREPSAGRAAFYLAESYFNCGRTRDAFEQYVRCTEHAHVWHDERHYAFLQCARIAQRDAKERGREGEEERAKESKSKKEEIEFGVVERFLIGAYNTIATPLVAMELFRLYRDDQKTPKSAFGPRANQAYAWIVAACFGRQDACHLHRNVRECDETRWALLGNAALHVGDARMAIRGYLNAQAGHLAHRTEKETEEEDSSGKPRYSDAFRICWREFGAQNSALFENIPIAFLERSLAAEMAATLGKRL